MKKCKKCRFYSSCILALFAKNGCKRFEQKGTKFQKKEIPFAHFSDDCDEINLSDI